MQLLGILFTIVLIVYGFLRKHSKVCFAMQGIWFWILVCFNAGGLDYEANKYIYDMSGSKLSFQFTGWLYDIIAYLFHRVGLSFFWFCIFTCSISIGILMYVVIKHSKYPALTMSLIMLYPMFDSCIQKRFFLAMAIGLLAFSFYVRGKHMKFYMTLFFAFGAHFSMVIYFVFPILEKVAKKRKYLLVILLLVEVVVLQFIGELVLLTNNQYLIAKFVDYSAGSNYSSLIIGILFILMQIMYIYMMVCIGKYQNEKLTLVDQRICFLNIISIILLPLMITDSVYLRYFRIFQILDYVYIGNVLNTKIRKRSLRYYYICIFVLMTIGYAIVTTHEEVRKTIFDYNLILGGMK